VIPIHKTSALLIAGTGSGVGKSLDDAVRIAKIIETRLEYAP
jgi:hypothetical protein